MTYQVRYEREAQKALKKMDKFQAKVILNWIEKNLVGTIVRVKPLTEG